MRVRAMPPREIINFPFGETLNSMNGEITLLVLQRQLSSAEEGEGEKPVARETIKVK